MSQPTMSQRTMSQPTIPQRPSVTPMAWIYLFHGTLYKFDEEGRDLVLSQFRSSPEVGNATCSYNVDDDIFEIGCLARDGDTATSTLAGIISEFIDKEATNEDQFEDYNPKVQKFPDSLAQEELLDSEEDVSDADDDSSDDQEEDDVKKEYWSPEANKVNLATIFTSTCLQEIGLATGTSLTLETKSGRILMKSKSEHAADEAVDRLENIAEYWDEEPPVEHIALAPPAGSFIIRFESLKNIHDGTLGRLLVTSESPLYGKEPADTLLTLFVCRSLRYNERAGQDVFEPLTVLPLPAPVDDPVSQAFRKIEYQDVGQEDPEEFPASPPASPVDPSMKGVENWIQNVGSGPASKAGNDHQSVSSDWTNHAPAPWKSDTAAGWGDHDAWASNAWSNPNAGQNDDELPAWNWWGEPPIGEYDNAEHAENSWEHDAVPSWNVNSSQTWNTNANEHWNDKDEQAGLTWDEDQSLTWKNWEPGPKSMSHKWNPAADLHKTESHQSFNRPQSRSSHQGSVQTFHTAQTARNKLPSVYDTPPQHRSGLRGSFNSPQSSKFNGRPSHGSVRRSGNQRFQNGPRSNEDTPSRKGKNTTGKLIGLDSPDDSRASPPTWNNFGNKGAGSKGKKPAGNPKENKKATNRFEDLANLDVSQTQEPSGSSQSSSGDYYAQTPPDGFLNGTGVDLTSKSRPPIETESTMDEVEEDEPDNRVFFRVGRQRAPAPGANRGARRGNRSNGKQNANPTSEKYNQKISPRSKALGELKESYQSDMPMRDGPPKESKREIDEELMSRQKAVQLGNKKNFPCKSYRLNGNCPIRPTCPYAHIKGPLPPCQSFLKGQCKAGDDCLFPHARGNGRGDHQIQSTSEHVSPAPAYRAETPPNNETTEKNVTITEKLFDTATKPAPATETAAPNEANDPDSAHVEKTGKPRKKKTKKERSVPTIRIPKKARKATRKQAPDDKFVAGVKAALERARFFRGVLSTELQLGKVVVSRAVDELTREAGIKQENFGKYMSRVRGFATMHETFTNMVTTKASDIPVALECAYVSPRASPVRSESYIELACEYSNHMICRVLVPVSKNGGNPYVVSEDEMIGAVYMHAPRNVWDARFLVTGTNRFELDAIAGAAPLVDSLFIRMSGGDTVPIVKGRDNEFLRVQSVRLFTKLRYSPRMTNAYEVEITRVHDYFVDRKDNAAAPNLFLFRAENKEEEIMIANQRLWYEVSLKLALNFSGGQTSAKEEKKEEQLIDLEPEPVPNSETLLKQNLTLGVGQKTAWQVDELVDGEAIRRVKDVARRMCEELDNVGASNTGPAAKLEKEWKEWYDRKVNGPDEYW